eukprot:206940-Prymnesium_polylepis.1
MAPQALRSAPGSTPYGSAGTRTRSRRATQLVRPPHQLRLRVPAHQRVARAEPRATGSHMDTTCIRRRILDTS